ncbi:hypothetical protein TIFTF001_012744 [Ficus carica]|uniref:Uncharacterized protein n=1 Tax=Ficus carica TaxID=3494 RepID=A0AA88AGH5_FICCA|nr:hypothetical protein TIFTF001_012744 [Ficus carica]
MLMPKISGTIPNVIARNKLVLHSSSASGHLQKEKHLEVIGILVGCLPRALRCLSVFCGLRCGSDLIGSAP